MSYTIPKEFMEPFVVRTCKDCGLDHASIRSCEETRLWSKAGVSDE